MEEFAGIANFDVLSTEMLIQSIESRTKAMKARYKTIPNDLHEARRCAVDALALSMALSELSKRQSDTIQEIVLRMQEVVDVVKET